MTLQTKYEEVKTTRKKLDQLLSMLFTFAVSFVLAIVFVNDLFGA